MKLVKIEQQGRVAEGFLEEGIVHLAGDWFAVAACDAPFTLGGLDGAELAVRRAQARESVALADVALVPPVDPRAKILCVGMNYRDHVGEIKLEVAANPTIFTRYADTLVGHEQPVLRPRVSQHFDYEGEIAVIIGRGGRHISEEEAMAHVGGYNCFMDGSVRDYQRHSLTAGKNFHASGAMGPWVVPAGAFCADDPLLETRLNGACLQAARASQMIFGIAQAIAYCSRWAVLRVGDVIATGTPGGVGSRREPPLWMKAGDRVEVNVEGIGVLANPVADEGCQRG